MSRLIILMLFLLVSFTWGTTWLAMRVAVETIPPIFATGMRFIVSSPLLIFVALITKTPLLFPAGRRFFQLAICVFYFSIPFTLMIYGEKYVSSSLASVIFANMPVAILIASVFILKEKISIARIIGLVVATVSLVNILLEESKSNVASPWQGILALILAVIIHAVMYTQCKKKCLGISVITFNALPCFTAGVMLFTVGWFFEKPQLADFSLNSIYATIYLGIFAGICGVLCYFSLQQKATAFQSSIVFLIFPIIAIWVENFVYGFTLSSHSMLLIIPFFLGVFLILCYPYDSAIDKERVHQ